LNLREASLDDAEFIFKLLNNPTWIKHIGDRKIRTVKDAVQYIEQSLIQSYNENGFGLYIMELKQGLIPLGLCGFLKRETLENVDIGFAILPEHAGQGFTYEAASQIIHSSEFPIIYGITYQANVASIKLLKKLGLRYLYNFQFGNYEEESMLFSNE